MRAAIDTVLSASVDAPDLSLTMHQGGGSHAPSKAALQKAHSPTHELPSPVTAASPANNGPSGKQPQGAGRQGAAAGPGEAKAQPTASTPSAAELAKAAAKSRVSQGAAAR